MLQNRKGALFYTMMVAEIMILLAFVVIISYRQSQADLNEIKTAVSQMSEKGKNTILIKTEGEVSDKVKKFLYGSDTISDPWSKLVNIERIENQLINLEAIEKELTQQVSDQETYAQNIEALGNENQELVTQRDELNIQLANLKSEKEGAEEENLKLRNGIDDLEKNVETLQETIETLKRNIKEEDKRKLGVTPCWDYIDPNGRYRPAPLLHTKITNTHYIVTPAWSAKNEEKRERQAKLLGIYDLLKTHNSNIENPDTPNSDTQGMIPEEFEKFGRKLYDISLNNNIEGATDSDAACRFFVDLEYEVDSVTKYKKVLKFFYLRSSTYTKPKKTS